jgi:hypothetical protein
MWLGRYFPGIPGGFDAVDQLLPEQTKVMREVGEDMLVDEEKGKAAHTKAIARASGLRML